MKESQARILLKLKPRENPRPRMQEFEKTLERKLAFVKNSPSPETKARYNLEYQAYKEAFETMKSLQEAKRQKPISGWFVTFVLLVVIGGISWWGAQQYQENLEQQSKEKERKAQNIIRINNQRKINELSALGETAILKRNWSEAAQIYARIRAINPHSRVADEGEAKIRQGKEDEKNQKIFYLLGKSQAALEAGEWKKASHFAQLVIDEYPDHQEASIRLREIKQKEQAQRIKLLEQAVTRSLESGDLTVAQIALEALQKKDPNNSMVSVFQARLKEAQMKQAEDKRKAVVLLKKAKLLDRGEFSSEAISLLDQARALDPNNADISELYQKMSHYTSTLNVPKDFATISEALDAARPRDLIRVAQGVYKESLLIDKNIRLEGAGGGKTVLEVPAKESAVALIAKSARGVRISGFSFKHVGFDYRKDRSSAVIVNGGDVTLASCEVHQAAGHGIAVIDGGKAVITGCKIVNSGWDGISVYGENSHADITNTLSEHNLQHGVEFWNGGYGTVNQSKFLANGLCGILAMSNGRKVDISTSLCARNRSAGILVSNGVTSTIYANRCDDNLLSGIVVRGKQTIASVSGCVTNGNHEVGILIHRGVQIKQFLNNASTKNKQRQIWRDAVIK